MQVCDVMTEGAQCIRPDTTVQEAARKMRDMDIGMLPICGTNDRLTGMVTDRDIAVRADAEAMDARTTPVRAVMTGEVIYCYEDQDIRDAAHLMRDRQVRRLVVLNRDKHLVGIVSLGDLAVDAGDVALVGDTLEGVSEHAMPIP